MYSLVMMTTCENCERLESENADLRTALRQLQGDRDALLKAAILDHHEVESELAQAVDARAKLPQIDDDSFH